METAASTLANPASDDLARLERDGFVVLDAILPKSEVEQARQELAALFDRDVEARQAQGINEAYFKESPIGQTIRTPQSHLALDMFGKSPVFDRLLDQMLTHPRVRRVVAGWCGPHFKIGSVNIRYMTGAIDPPPAHELHRDGAYAMNLCIMLSDVEPGDNAATAIVPGTQWSSLDPRWDTLFEAPFRLRNNPSRSGLSLFLRWNIFNNIYKARMFKKITGAFGKQGDVYFFANGETWHGRLPNMNGRRTMICLMGCAATKPEFLNSRIAVPDATLAKLPPALAKHLVGPFEINDTAGTMVDRIYKTRPSAPFFSLERWCKIERHCAEWISSLVVRWALLIRGH